MRIPMKDSFTGFDIAHRTACLFLAALPCVLAASHARAEIACGDVPTDVPIAIQEQLKGEVEGKAQAVTKLLGSANLKGAIDTSRTELHEEHRNLDQHQIDMYSLWVFCQIISSEKTMSAADKAKLLMQVRSSFGQQSSRNFDLLHQPDQLPPHLLLSLFMTEESRITGAIDNFTWRPITFYHNKNPYKVYCLIYYDKSGHTKFISVYVPSGQDLVDLLSSLIDHVGEFLEHSLKNPVINWRAKVQGESEPETFSSFPFSGRIYIYYEGTLGSEELGDLSRAYKARGMAAEFRGSDYLLAVWENILLGTAIAPPEFAIRDDTITKVP